MKKYSVLLGFVVFVIGMVFSTAIKADTGPKPSVCITFEHMGDEVCYGTLLSKDESTGPYSVWNGSKEEADTSDMGYKIWKAFVDYKDIDGYYFLQEAWQCNETKNLEWTYYPPSTFKILLYYPETNTFVASGIYERYAFDSYFTVDMSKVRNGILDAQKKNIVAQQSYDYKAEIISLGCRIVITIVLEIAIALLFGFRKKKQLGVIALINIVTQIILNVLLNIINYHQGTEWFVINYILLEMVVFAIEAVLYNVVLNRVSEQKVSVKRIVSYALVANVCSFAGGLVIAKIIPVIF